MSSQPPRESSGSVRQVPCYPECGEGVQPSLDGGEPDRRRENGPVGADSMEVAQEPGQLDSEGNLGVGIDFHETVCDRHFPQAAAGASKHLQWEGFGGG